MDSVRCAWVWIILFTFALPLPLLADEYNSFIRAKNAFDRGDYQEAVSRFDELIERGVRNPALLLECHKLMGVSYLFVGDRDAAENQFSKLLTIAPEFDLDPMLFPIEVVDFFNEIKLKNEEKLKTLAQARAREEKRRKEREEAKRQAELEALRQTIYYERTKQQNSLLVALIPFGAGQFQNGHKVKGALFLAGELLFVSAAVTTFFLHANLRSQASEPFQLSSEREKAERLELGYRIANRASLVGLGALIAGGIIDSLYNFQRERTTWQRIEEGAVPDGLREKGKKKTKLSLIPSLGTDSVGMVVRGRF